MPVQMTKGVLAINDTCGGIIFPKGLPYMKKYDKSGQFDCFQYRLDIITKEINRLITKPTK